MTVLYFAHARRITALDREEITSPSSISTEALWQLLITRHPGLASLRPCSRLARNNDFLPADALLAPNDEIAVIPPVSGG